MQREKRTLVLHVITRLDFGGSSRQVLELAEGIRDHGFDSAIVTGRTVDPHVDLEEYRKRTGIRIVMMDELRRDPDPLRDVCALYMLCRIIKSMNPDLVHTNCSKAGILGRLAARMAGKKPVVHTPHGHLFYGYYGPLATRCISLAEKLTAPLARRIVLLTRMSIDEHVSRGIGRRDRFTAISPGIDLSKFRADPEEKELFREEMKIPANVRVVGWAGRLTQIKSPQTFLEAASIVKDTLPDVHFAILGEGELMDHLRERARLLRFGDRITFMGKGRHVERFMSAIDLFVLSSLNEGLGIVLLEAMAAGVPVIATAVGGVPEVLDGGRAGLLVRPNDPLALARCMRYVLENNEVKRELARTGRDRAGQYTGKRSFEEYVHLYTEILGNGSKGVDP